MAPMLRGCQRGLVISCEAVLGRSEQMNGMFYKGKRHCDNISKITAVNISHSDQEIEIFSCVGSFKSFEEPLVIWRGFR